MRVAWPCALGGVEAFGKALVTDLWGECNTIMSYATTWRMADKMCGYALTPATRPAQTLRHCHTSRTKRLLFFSRTAFNHNALNQKKTGAAWRTNFNAPGGFDLEPPGGVDSVPPGGLKTVPPGGSGLEPPGGRNMCA